jgi:hypothetical protein
MHVLLLLSVLAGTAPLVVLACTGRACFCVQARAPHIPFRTSKLTMLLKHAFVDASTRLRCAMRMSMRSGPYARERGTGGRMDCVRA